MFEFKATVITFTFLFFSVSTILLLGEYRWFYLYCLLLVTIMDQQGPGGKILITSIICRIDVSVLIISLPIVQTFINSTFTNGYLLLKFLLLLAFRSSKIVPSCNLARRNVFFSFFIFEIAAICFVTFVCMDNDNQHGYLTIISCRTNIFVFETFMSTREIACWFLFPFQLDSWWHRRCNGMEIFNVRYKKKRHYFF